MFFCFDFDHMERLLQHFTTISGLRYSLIDEEGVVRCHSSVQPAFCQIMNDLPDGHSRCAQCDAAAIAQTRQQKAPYLTYRCHAGLLETVIPIRRDGDPLGYICFGPVLDLTDREGQWQHTRSRISWMEDPDRMAIPFAALTQADSGQLESCAEILRACSSHIVMQCVINTASMTDEQQLTRYIEEHYPTANALDDIAAALSMSKTKLCRVAARQGTTVKTMLNTRRMEEAKRMLRHSGDRISEIAELVGLQDYNYFTKQFKAYTGETPRSYRRRHQPALPK